MHCVKCGGSVPEGAAFCPSCGQSVSAKVPSAPVKSAQAPPTRKSNQTRSCLIVLGCIFGAFVLIAILTPTPKSSVSNSAGATNMAASDTTNASADTQVTDNSPWTYSQDEDKIRGATTYYAVTTSTNSIDQDFPYDSDTTMRMTVRKSPAYGTDVVLTISSGQMMCPSYEGCSGTVRFDNEPAERVSFAGPEDSDSETIFVQGAKNFIAKLKKAKKVTIEKTLYQAGSPQFEFDVHGLKWDH